MKSVIITGANRGIGLETAIAFARAGYQVFATMRNPDKAIELKNKIASESLTIAISVMDVDSDESVNRAMDTILELNGPVDVLVNNAGIERQGSVEEMELADFKSVMETNYFGVLRCTKKVLPSMRERRSGCIINISSVAGRVANSPLGAYMATKFALEAISESLAGEVKPYNIHVAIVEPGIISTDMARRVKHRQDSLWMPTDSGTLLSHFKLRTNRPTKFKKLPRPVPGLLRHPLVYVDKAINIWLLFHDRRTMGRS